MSTVTVDPRIRARRASVARDAGRRRLRRLLALAAVIAVALLALALTWTPALDIERIDVRGVSHTSPDAVTEAAGITPGDPLAWFDADAAEQGIAALPWVDDVVITRSWTGEVGIEVTERTPVAGIVAPGEDAWLLVDGEGRVLATVGAEPTDVAVMDGVTASAEPGDRLDDDALGALAVAAAIPEGLRPDVARVSGTGTGTEFEAALRAGGVIALGGPDEAEAKLRAAAAVLATVTPGCVDRLDVALPDAPALVRVPGCV
ncbi:MAG TPA: FtsQ-type POTRA domain-containing protein [Acidimicrobiales bacterium]